ncbi:MAG: Ig-like domain-containing protein [Woeseiaceae bacterium]
MNRAPIPSAGPVLPLLLLVCLNACTAGDGSGLNVAGRPLQEGGDLPLAPTLDSLQANVFDSYCVVCHSGAGAPQGLRLDAASSYASLVGVPSQEVGALLRVEPGNPDASYLIRKLEGTATEGGQMPLGAPPLPRSTIDFVRQWITEGAQPISAAATGPRPLVVSLSPAAGSTGVAFPAHIVAGFDRDIDASTVNELTFTLTRSGGDGRFEDGNEFPVPAPVSLSRMNPRVAIMDLRGVEPIVDVYRISLEGSGPNLILSVDGESLDGDSTAEFEVGGSPVITEGATR